MCLWSGLKIIYTILGKRDYQNYEFVFTSTEISIANYKLEGYLFINMGKVDVIEVFINDEIITLFSSNMLANDENVYSLKKISDYLKIDVNHIRELEYSYNESIKILQL
jgi:hypothetical protein